MLVCSLVSVPPPYIITQPTDTSAAAPFSGVFTCSAGGHGLLNIEWYRSNVLLEVLPKKSVVSQISTLEVTTSTLVIPNVTNNDVGSYYCVVWAGRQAALSEKVKLDIAGMLLYYYTDTVSTVCLQGCTYATFMLLCLQKPMLNINYASFQLCSSFPQVFHCTTYILTFWMTGLAMDGSGIYVWKNRHETCF